MKQNLRALTVSAIMGALGAVLMYLEFALPIIPSFIKFDFSELPALITSFAFGPIYGIAVCLIKNLIHAFFGSSLGIGEISNFILGSVFVGVAGFICKMNKTKRTALLGSIIGSFSMAVISLISNYFVVYPLYSKIMPYEVILGMYQTILPSVKSIFEALIIFNLPFTLVKGLVDTLLCILLYKKLSPVIKGKQY